MPPKSGLGWQGRATLSEPQVQSPPSAEISMPPPQLPTRQLVPLQVMGPESVPMRRAWQREFAAAPVQVRPAEFLEPLIVTNE